MWYLYIYLVPKPVKGWEKNYLQTTPVMGFFVWFRSYYPTVGLFDGSWKLNDVEKVK